MLSVINARHNGIITRCVNHNGIHDMRICSLAPRDSQSRVCIYCNIATRVSARYPRHAGCASGNAHLIRRCAYRDHRAGKHATHLNHRLRPLSIAPGGVGGTEELPIFSCQKLIQERHLCTLNRQFIVSLHHLSPHKDFQSDTHIRPLRIHAPYTRSRHLSTHQLSRL